MPENETLNDETEELEEFLDETEDPSDYELTTAELEIDEEIKKDIEDVDKMIDEYISDDNSKPLDSLGLYLSSIGSIPLLTQEEELNYAKQVKQGLNLENDLNENMLNLSDIERQKIINNAAYAKKQLVERNLRLVVPIAKHYKGVGLPLLDAIQEGNLGLMKAVDKFDPDKGFRFSTYATWWIRRSVTRGIFEKSRLIQLPVHVGELLNKIKLAKANFISEYSYEPSDEELANFMDIPVAKIRQCAIHSQDLISLDLQINNDDSKSDTDLYEVLEDKQTLSPEKNAMYNALAETLDKALNELKPRDADIVRRYFGLAPYERHMTLEQIGKIYNITRERVRQINEKSLERLLKYDRKYQLSDFKNM